MGLTTKTKYVSGFVTCKDMQKNALDKVYERLAAYCNETCELYFLALHDKDVNEDNTPKALHIHFVLTYKFANRRISTNINNMATYLHVSPLAITMSQLVSLEGAVQYLIHKNDSKYKYDKDIIRTNVSSDELDNILCSSVEGFGIEVLINVVNTSKSKIEIMRRIGLGRYQQYRNVINDLIVETEFMD